MTNNYHISVLKEEALNTLNVESGKTYIDGTMGGGGHTFEILRRGGKVLAIDVDEDAVAHVKKLLKEKPEFTDRLVITKGNFSDIKALSHKKDINSVSGVLFDLGVSSYQIDTPERGFSFRNSGPLDMRMSKKLSVTARDLVNGLSKKELVTLFEKLGEEYRARTIAERIVVARKKESIETTSQLARLIGEVSERDGRTDPATKVFQALRIAVNDELHNLREGLRNAFDLLDKDGRLVVISFHSLEDRIVKEAFKNFSETRKGTIITDKPVVPTEAEKESNPRSRSAKMRVISKN